MKKVNSIMYGLLGAVALLYGIVNFFFPAFMVKEAAFNFLVSHLLREQAAMAIFLGCMFFWCIFNYERRRSVHCFLIVFTALLAAIHWTDYLRGHLNWKSAAMNTVPVVLLTAMALISRRSRVSRS